MNRLFKSIFCFYNTLANKTYFTFTYISHNNNNNNYYYYYYYVFRFGDKCPDGSVIIIIIIIYSIFLLFMLLLLLFCSYNYYC